MLDKACVFIMAAGLHLFILTPVPGSAWTYPDSDDLPIQYPGPKKDMCNRLKSQEVPDECKNQTFCTIKPKDYPQELFDQLLKGTTKLVKVPNLVVTKEMEAGIELNRRQGGPGEDDDCRARVTYEPLYKVRSKRTDDWRDVVNSEEHNFLQKVRMETCVTAGSKCFKPYGEAVGYETFCKQKYNSWEIVVSDGKGGTETITTDLPVCCSCFYRSTTDLASRFGKPKN